jgi:hypothetical protein
MHSYENRSEIKSEHCAAQVADVEHRFNAKVREALQSVRNEQHDAVRGWKAELDRRANEV